MYLGCTYTQFSDDSDDPLTFHPTPPQHRQQPLRCIQVQHEDVRVSSVRSAWCVTTIRKIPDVSVLHMKIIRKIHSSLYSESQFAVQICR